MLVYICKHQPIKLTTFTASTMLPIVVTSSSSHEPVQAEEEGGATDFPEGGLSAWLTVFGAFCLLLPTFGLMTSVGLIQVYWTQNQLSDYSRTAISWIPSVFVFLALLLGVQVGKLFDRYGPRITLIVGTIGYIAANTLLAFCTQYWHFMLCFGVLGGVSAAIITTVASSVVSHWFKKRRAIACGVAMMGSAAGGISFPLILRVVLERFSWKTSMHILDLVVVGLLLVGNACVRSRLPPGTNGPVVDLECFRDARFTWLTASVFGMCYLTGHKRAVSAAFPFISTTISLP